uniref:RING-CH-type domain-containing protein n=1 Tax=Macrostomum lignano TaxID=282301 RepID=A0A1I8FNJ1_9PLAT
PLHLQHYQHQLPVSAGVSPDTADSQADICRICHCPDTDPAGDNPLISPCLCSGSLKYVHRDCLQHWVKSQDIKVCELCKFGFVMRVTTKPISERLISHHRAHLRVIWSLYVLIEKTSAEINSGKLEWPFWTKLVVVAIASRRGAQYSCTCSAAPTSACADGGARSIGPSLFSRHPRRSSAGPGRWPKPGRQDGRVITASDELV